EKKMRRRGWWLCWAGGGLFAASLFMPAFHVMDWAPGWDCLVFVNQVAVGLLVGHLGGVEPGWGFYPTGFALMNLLMIASLFFVWWSRRDLRKLRKAGLAALFAAIYTASFWVVGACTGGFSAIGDLHVGYYSWVLSFALVAAGALHLAVRRPKSSVNS